MRFEFDEKKAAQAAALLTKLEGGRINYTKLLKLMYLAERAKLIARGSMITGDDVVSMPLGPVLSTTLRLIKREAGTKPTHWARYLTAPVEYEVELTEAARSLSVHDSTDSLSNTERKLLHAVYEQHGHLTWKELVRLTHKLPEWKDPKGSSKPLDKKIILRSANKSEDEIEAIACRAEANASPG